MAHESSIDRRLLLQGAAASAVMLSHGSAAAKVSDADRKAIQKAITANHDATVKQLQDWIANPSIAAENRKMTEGADYMKRLALDAGFQQAEVISTDGHPGVFATMDNGAKTWFGIYFMYDVKQFDPAEWTSPPLEARLIDKPEFGKVMMGRGAVNQKGPETAFLAAVKAFKAAGRKLPVNLVLVAEGEEEIASPHFYQVVQNPKVMPAMQKCVGIIIPSASQARNGQVTINLGAKGAVELELVSSAAKWGRGPAQDLHSSEKARVDSPAWHLIAALSTLVTPDGNTPVIEGWFDKVRPLTAREKELVAQTAASTSEAEAMASRGVKVWIDNLDYRSSIERLVSQPTVNIQGLVGGYTGPGGKTILPSRALAKIDLRLVPNMTREDCVAKLKAHLAKKGFGDIEVNVSGGYDPTETPENSQVIQAQLAVFKTHGAPATLYPRSAGSWPGSVFTGPPLNLPAGQFGLGYGQGAHAPDEFYVIESKMPKVAGLDEVTMGFVDYLYEIAARS
ncbi:MAG TPA: M20/M25/M40 family metallo-hydrolase [Hyphomonadaceae bacterium]|nr:M20/M25/M40 family metallo-hydrolase [Hyphomonadaceae bacterium]